MIAHLPLDLQEVFEIGERVLAKIGVIRDSR